MAKKQKPSAPKKPEYNRSPFSNLKGFSVSADEVEKISETSPCDEVKEAVTRSFADEMAQLGVERINAPEAGDEQSQREPPVIDDSPPDLDQSEEQQFLQAMGALQVNFSDNLPAADEPPTASAGRMKQLKQGKLVPESSLDLHGLTRTDVAEKLQSFLQNADRHGWQTLLVVTGRGLHSADGEPVLRSEMERYLAAEGRKWVAEWSRAPKQYGGDGALVLFLRKKAR